MTHAHLDHGGYRHLEATLPSAKNTVLFVGFQAEGTRGRMIVDGIRQVRMKGRDIPVAARIERLDSMSAHADAAEIMRWLSLFSRPPSMTYLVHGESAALAALRGRIQSELKWPVHVARYEERIELQGRVGDSTESRHLCRMRKIK